MPALLMLLDFVPTQRRTFESFLIRLTEEMRIAGWNVIFVFSGAPSRDFEMAVSAAGAVHRTTRFPLDRKSCDELTASLAGMQILAMTNTFISIFDPCLLTIKRRLGIRYWMPYDESSGLASPKSMIKRFLARIRGWYYGRHIDRVLTVSEFVAQRNIKQSFLPATRIQVLSNGVDLDRYRPTETSDFAAKKENVVLYVGQLIREKGVLTLLRAMLLLKTQFNSHLPQLHLVGKGVYEAELRAFVTEHGLDNVQFLGQSSDVERLYREATVVVVPSEWAEAFGFVVAEAMACGACVLTSDAGALPELIGKEQIAGRLFQARNPEDLARQLHLLLTNPAARAIHCQAARKRAEELFDINKMVKGFVRELLEVTHTK